MQHPSTSDSDGTTWVTAGLPLGQTGLDLRKTGGADALVELLNARFLGDKTVCRRDGHTSRLVQDYTMPALDKTVLDTWTYGHGTRVRTNSNANWENAKHPIHNRARGTFSHGDSDVAWTGDRLLVATADGPFYGGSTHWSRLMSTTPDNRGIPAFLPVQTDSSPPGAVAGNSVETCLTKTLRVVAYTVASGDLWAWVINRETGVAVSNVLVDTGPVTGVRVVNSGVTPFLLYRKGGGVTTAYWTGAAWSTPSVLRADAEEYDVAMYPGGFHVLYLAVGVLRVGSYVGALASGTPYVFGTTVNLGGYTVRANSPIALACSPTGELAAVWLSVNSIICRTLTNYGVSGSAPLVVTTEPSASWDSLTVSYRGLKNSGGRQPVVIHATQTGGTRVEFYEVTSYTAGDTGFTMILQQVDIRYNCELASKSFTVGDEVFAWLRARNSSTNFLAGGVYRPQISAVSDREVAVAREIVATRRTLAMVAADPLDTSGVLWTWIRPFYIGAYSHAGNTRIGDLNFLPRLSTARLGQSTYIAGSHVRAWDGVELGDAGFHDYPLTAYTSQSSGGTLTALGTYQLRVYPVRYNKAGERFQGAAITSKAPVLTAGNQTITWTIQTMPVTNHDDVVFEVYRTSGLTGTAFFYEGSVTNNRASRTLTWVSSAEFVTTNLPLADPHAAGAGVLSELTEFGPLGCEVLVTAGDRLWGIGGQVPAGSAQFSKLYEPLEGAGFDALAGTQVIDAAGGKLTSIAPFADTVVVVFQAKQFYVLAGDGPNNYGTGAFQVPQLVVADGAINHAGTCVLPQGIAFWGAGGPRLLSGGFQVSQIADPIQSLVQAMTPSGVRVDYSRREVVWYTESGSAVLLNYLSGARWARWTGLPVSGCSSRLLATPDGRLLTPTALSDDDGRPFIFKLATGNINLERVLAGGTLLRKVGMVGEYVAKCRPRFRVFYDGAPLWGESFRWSPADNTWLSTGTDLATMTAAQIDALKTLDRSGSFGTDRRVKHQNCRYFRVEISDVGENGFIPYELIVEVGVTAGLARVAPNKYGA